MQDNGDFTQWTQLCHLRWTSVSPFDAAHIRCYVGESIEKSIINPTDEPADPEYPIKLYEG